MTEEIDLLREQVRRFARLEMLPRVPSMLEQGKPDETMWRALGTLGMILPELPERYGGAGSTLAHQLAIQDELVQAGGWGDAVHAIVAHYILGAGTEEQRRRWLPKMASGDWIGAIAMTEPGCGSDLKSVRTRAVREGDHYVINGAKTFITNARTSRLMLVVARTDPAAGAKGISLIGVETRDSPGFKVGRVLDKIGLHASDTCEISLENVRVPVENLLGGVEGHGFHQLMSQLPYERLLIAVNACASVDRALRLTIDYARQRKAFGQALLDFQTARHRLAELATVAHVARCFLNDCIQRLVDGRLDPTAAYMAKLWCTEQQGRVVDECLQLFGGYGYMMEYPIARLYVDARAQRIYGGTSEIMKELIARAL